MDNGKPYSDAAGDVEQSIKVLEYYAGWADKIHGDTIPTGADTIQYTRGYYTLYALYSIPTSSGTMEVFVTW